MTALVDAISPARLGRPFRPLLSAVVVMNLGDGIVVAAGPLLVASLTRDPFLVSLAFLCDYLPALVFGTVAGVIVDRQDRRRIAIFVNLARAVVLAGLAAMILTGTISIAVVLTGLLLLGTAETFGDLATTSLLPRLVPRTGLGIANARLQAGYIFTNQLIGPPIGAFLFVFATSMPFAVDAIAYVLGAALILRIAASDAAPHAAAVEGDLEREDGPSTSIRHDLLEGARWLRDHRPMRTLVLTIVAFNVTFGAAWSVLVLYTGDRLGMDSVGFGLLTTASAIGGAIGTFAYGALERRFSLGNIMRVGLIIETFTHLTLALTRSPAVALVTMVVFGAHAFVWGTTATSIRQRAVPDQLIGRVSGIYRVGVFGGIVVGTPIGGLLARQFGITAPFWFGFIGSAILVVILWREFAHIAHSGEVEPEAIGAPEAA
ncbi:MAG TPA: MFS transporter [Candidatus Dormibacteraeota bacterium]|nr:MFS transporter [Candidatus Dormibacteraeota bacterium]